MVGKLANSNFEFDVMLEDYRQKWPQETATVELFEQLLRDYENPYCRSCAFGHFTGSAWLVSKDQQRVLLTHHRKLDRWLQLGGHADGNANLLEVALTEAFEESGLPDLIIEPHIFDLDRHWIPARKNESAHWHYDLRFVVQAGESEAFVVSDESHELAWRVIADLQHSAEVDDSIKRMANKWRARR